MLWFFGLPGLRNHNIWCGKKTKTKVKEKIYVLLRHDRRLFLILFLKLLRLL
jgi:hypothetical protein